MVPMTQSYVTTSFTGQGKQAWRLVDKWETEEIRSQMTIATNIARYFELFEENISPKSNALIAIVELKRLFQESMSLEDFHTQRHLG